MSLGTPPDPARTPPDPARQPERTRLSWRRTVLASTVVVLLAIRLAGHEHLTLVRLALLVVALAGWLALLALSWHRIAALADRRPPPAGRSVPATTLIVVGLAGLGTALTLGRM